MVHPVAKSIGMTLVYLTDGDVDLEAVIDFFFLRLRLIDDSNSKDIIDRNGNLDPLIRSLSY